MIEARKYVELFDLDSSGTSTSQLVHSRGTSLRLVAVGITEGVGVKQAIRLLQGTDGRRN